MATKSSSLLSIRRGIELSGTRLLGTPLITPALFFISTGDGMREGTKSWSVARELILGCICILIAL